MKNLKTFEEYSIFSTVVFAIEAGMWIGLLFWKYVSIPRRKKKEILKNLKDTSWWRSMMVNQVSPNKIEISRKRYNASDEVVFEIDIEKRRLKFNSEYDSLKIDVKVSQKEMDELLQRLNKYKEYPEDMANIFQDIKDEFNYKVNVENNNFQMSKFTIVLEREGKLPWYMSRDGEKAIISKKPVKEVVTMCQCLEEAIDRIEDMYHVKLVNKIPVTLSPDERKSIIHKNVDGKLKIKSIKTDGGLLKTNDQGGKTFFDIDFEILLKIPDEMNLTFEDGNNTFDFSI